MRGDLLFYRASAHSPIERLIAWATHGPFSHVAVDCGDGTIIEAQATGVRRVALTPDNESRVVRFSPPPSTPASEETAFRWLMGKLGAKYGWFDIVDAVLHTLHLAVYLGHPNEFDCSDLAACFVAIWTNDPVLMNQVLDYRQDISPNDLARYYHVAG